MVCKIVIDKVIEQCTGCVVDASVGLFRDISIQLDAHKDLWISFAKHLGLDEDFIAQNEVLASDGSSPSQRFMLLLYRKRPNMTVENFQGMLQMYDMKDVAKILYRERGYIANIGWEMEHRICAQLSLPEVEPRWKIMAEKCLMMPAEIEEIESKVNVICYSPTARMLNVYRRQCPQDNFDKIREFLSNLL